MIPRKKVNFLTIWTILTLIVLISVVFASPQESKDRKKDEQYAKKVERRIDKLHMVIEQKEAEGIDTRKAEGLLEKAIELFKQGKYEEAMNVMDDVERAMGLQPLRDDMPGQDEKQFRPHPEFGPPPPPRELTDKEKDELKAEIKKLIKEAHSLIEKGDFESAFKPLSEAHMKLAKLTGKFMPMPPMPPMEGQPPMPPDEPWRQRFRGSEGPNPPFPPPPGEEGFYGPGPMPERGRGFEPGMNPPKGEFDPEIHFRRLREMGEEGYQKAIKFFDMAVQKMKERDIKVDERALKKYEESQKLHQDGNLDAAFDTLREAFMILRDCVPRDKYAPFFDRERKREGAKFGRDDSQKGKGLRDLSKEEREQLENALKSLREAYRQYVDKFGNDEFIKEKFQNFKDIERAVRRGDMKLKDGLAKLGSIEKEIRKKLEEK